MLKYYKFFAMTLLLMSCTSHKENTKNSGSAIVKDLIQRTTLSGTVIPFRKAIITAPYNGYVKKLFVKTGESITKGSPLVSLSQSLQTESEEFPLRAPFSGTVVQIEKSEGEYVKENDTSQFILRIDDTSKLYVNAVAPEIDRVKLKIGQEAIVTATALLNQQYKGVIREMSMAAKEKDQWSRSQVVEFSVKIEVLNPDDSLKSGMTTLIDVITDKKEKVLFLRHEFIRKENNEYFVTTTNKEKKSIKLGIQNEEGFEILSGITEKDQLTQVDYLNEASQK